MKLKQLEISGVDVLSAYRTRRQDNLYTFRYFDVISTTLIEMNMSRLKHQNSICFLWYVFIYPGPSP
jgi:hypothetical protein